jgi:hypothetical protein
VWGRAHRPSERSAASQSKPCAQQASKPNYHPGRSKAHRQALEAYASEAHENELMKTRRIKTRRFWTEIVVLAAGTACALGLLLACLGAVAAVASEHKPAQPSAPPIQEGQPQSQEAQPPGQEPPQRTYTGMVTCSQCGARHPAASAKTAAGCTRACVHGGAQFALVEGEKTYLLNGDLAPLKKLAGQRATIVGAMSGNTITISSVAAAI